MFRSTSAGSEEIAQLRSEVQTGQRWCLGLKALQYITIIQEFSLAAQPWGKGPTLHAHDDAPQPSLLATPPPYAHQHQSSRAL